MFFNAKLQSRKWNMPGNGRKTKSFCLSVLSLSFENQVFKT